jgi:hypothetical protein
MLPDTIKLPRVTLRYNGLFDFDAVYSAIIDWAKNYGYMWHEVDYKHKVPSPKGAEQEFKWLLTIKITEYVSYEILMTVHGWDLMEVEVESEGRKKSLLNGRLYIWIDPTIYLDYQKKFSKSGILGKTLGNWYKNLNEKEISNHCDQLVYRCYNLHAILKTYFDMQTKKHQYKRYLNEN